MCLDHCQAPDEWQHRQAVASKGQSNAPEPFKPWPYSLDNQVAAAQIRLQMSLSESVNKNKDQMFWHNHRGPQCKNS